MAKKGGSKGNGIYDYHTLTQDQKHKISQIHDIFPDIHKESIAVVLEYCDFDDVKAMDVFTQDGGSDAIKSWLKAGHNQIRSNSKSKKRNKKKNKKENGPAVSSAAIGTDAEDSSSLHSSNIDLREKESSNRIDILNDIDQPVKIEEEIKIMCDRVLDVEYVGSELSGTKNPVVKSQNKPCEDPKMQCIFKEESNSYSQNCNACHADLNKGSETVQFWSDSVSEIQHDQTEKEDRSKPSKEGSHPSMSHKSTQRQRHGSFHHSKTPSISEDITSQTSSAPKKGGFEKCKKDLMRQSVSLQRIENQMENGLEESNKRMKSIFIDIRKLLDKRQCEVEEEMEKVKHDAMDLLKNRQELATDLKRRVDRLPSMNETEWNELRTDIKQFVTERKYDEELGKTIWFHWSMDGIVEAINNLGEVTPVRNVYSQRLHAGLSHGTSQSNPEPDTSAASISADKEVETVSGKSDGENTLLSSVNEAKVEKDIPQVKPQGQVENRSRVFSSRRHNQPNYTGWHPPNHNRGRGFRWQGNVGGNFPRVRHYENFRQYGERNNDYRQHQSHERTEYHPASEDKELDSLPVAEDVSNGTIAMGQAAFKENNRESYKNHERGHRGYRGQHKSYNYYGRSRGANKNPRSNPEHVSSGIEPVIDRNSNFGDQSSQQKLEIVNGFISHQ